MANDNDLSVRIRMYRQGLGDCFVLTFRQKDTPEYNMMIDCGLLVGTANGPQRMREIVENLRINLPDQKRLDAVVLTHEHADHISGFTQAQAVFDRMEFGEVWAGWVDDEKHPKYKAVRERFHKQITGLKAAVARMSPGQQNLKDTITALTDEFFEPDVLGASKSKTGRSPSWDYVLNKAEEKRFHRPGDMFTLPGYSGVRIYVLGPSEEFETFTRVNPPKDESYRHEKGSNFALADSFFAAAASNEDSIFDSELSQPFESHLRFNKDEARKDVFFKSTYYCADAAWQKIDDDWLAMAGSLALNLDSYTNNTCLALAIEFVESGKVMLFPGDAQFANWMSWQKLSWEVSDADGTKRIVKVDELLKRTVLYKVGHHGSHNATLRTHGLEMMSSPNLAAMIPVSREKAEKKKWEMPEANLFSRLKEKTQGRIIIADEHKTTELGARCTDAKFVKSVSYGGAFSTDPTGLNDPLYVELTIDA